MTFIDLNAYPLCFLDMARKSENGIPYFTRVHDSFPILVYVGIFTLHALLLHEVNFDGFRAAHVVFASEVCKCIVSALYVCIREDGRNLLRSRRFSADGRLVITALLYTIYNIISFQNVKSNGPLLYHMLMNSRILFTPLFAALIIGAIPSRRTALAVALLFVGF